MRALIVDEMHPSITALLLAVGVPSDYAPRSTRDEVLAQIGGYQGVVVRSKLRLDKEFFSKATALRFVARAGAGMDNIDLAAAQAAGVTIFNAPEGNQDAVAEHTVGLLLGLLNRIPQGDAEVRAGHWLRTRNRGHELGGKTVGIIGYGHMGRAFAQRLQGFGCRLIAYDKYAHVPDGHFAQGVSAEQLFAEGDVISLHVPLTPETRGMCNARWFARFARPIWLLNTARGEVVHLLDLLYAIKTNRVCGAGLDVLENEKLDELLTLERVVLQALAATEKVIFTPHVAGWTDESYMRINQVLADKIAAWLATQP